MRLNIDAILIIQIISNEWSILESSDVTYTNRASSFLFLSQVVGNAESEGPRQQSVQEVSI